MDAILIRIAVVAVIIVCIAASAWIWRRWNINPARTPYDDIPYVDYSIVDDGRAADSPIFLLRWLNAIRKQIKGTLTLVALSFLAFVAMELVLANVGTPHNAAMLWCGLIYIFAQIVFLWLRGGITVDTLTVLALAWRKNEAAHQNLLGDKIANVALKYVMSEVVVMTFLWLLPPQYQLLGGLAFTVAFIGYNIVREITRAKPFDWGIFGRFVYLPAMIVIVVATVLNMGRHAIMRVPIVKSAVNKVVGDLDRTGQVFYTTTKDVKPLMSNGKVFEMDGDSGWVLPAGTSLVHADSVSSMKINGYNPETGTVLVNGILMVPVHAPLMTGSTDIGYNTKVVLLVNKDYVDGATQPQRFYPATHVAATATTPAIYASMPVEKTTEVADPEGSDGGSDPLSKSESKDDPPSTASGSSSYPEYPSTRMGPPVENMVGRFTVDVANGGPVCWAPQDIQNGTILEVRAGASPYVINGFLQAGVYDVGSGPAGNGWVFPNSPAGAINIWSQNDPNRSDMAQVNGHKYGVILQYNGGRLCVQPNTLNHDYQKNIGSFIIEIFRAVRG